MLSGHAALLASVKRNGVALTADPETAMLGYVLVAGCVRNTPGVDVVSVAVMFDAVVVPRLVSVTFNVAPSPTLIAPLPLPGLSAATTTVSVRKAAPTRPAAFRASHPMTMPAPESRSTPAASMSMALDVMAIRIWLLVSAGFADLIKAAIAAACGAAADVPKKGVGKPPTPVTATPSA